MSNDRNRANRILGEDCMMPGRALLLKALATHAERDLIEELDQERDEHGERRWSLCRQVEEDGWVEIWVRPWPLDRFDVRPPIRVGAWPEKIETERLAYAQVVVEEYGDTP